MAQHKLYSYTEAGDLMAVPEMKEPNTQSFTYDNPFDHFGFDFASYQKALSEYNAHVAEVAKLPRIPCSDSLKALLQKGQVYELDKDFRLQEQYHNEGGWFDMPEKYGRKHYLKLGYGTRAIAIPIQETPAASLDYDTLRKQFTETLHTIPVSTLEQYATPQQETPAPAAGSEAIAFADWLCKNNYIYSHYSKNWKQWLKIGDVSSCRYSTKELYEIFTRKTALPVEANNNPQTT